MRIDVGKLKKINGFNDYYLSGEGEVYSIKIKKLTPTDTIDGYKQYHFCENGAHKYPREHRIIAETLLPNPHNLPVVNHKDGNKTNNDISNLEWATYSENSLHSVHVLNNKPPITCEKPMHTINITTNEKLRFDSLSNCARYYGVTQSAISSKINGRSNNPPTIGKLKNIKFILGDEEGQTTIESN